MKKWQPLYASLLVIAIALGGMAVWRFSSGPKSRAANNTPANLPANAPDDGGLTYEWTKLEDLPAMDPLGLYPRDGERLAAPEFWIMWRTTTHTQCRLLATKDSRDWYNLGRTAGELHFLSANLGYFDSQLSFSVEWESNGKKYRSEEREVSFGKGAAFGQRRYKFTLGNERQPTWELELTGADARELGRDPFLFTESPDGLTPFAVVTDKADTVVFGVGDASAVKQGCAIFLQVRDRENQTYDRVLIELSR